MQKSAMEHHHQDGIQSLKDAFSKNTSDITALSRVCVVKHADTTL